MRNLNTRNKQQSAIIPLFLVVLIDGMGLGLLFPILSSIIIDTDSNFLSATVSLGTRNFLYGFTVGIFMICWFFGAAILGNLSDTVGRKKSLMICLVGAFLGYLLSAIAITQHSLLFLIIGRIIAGFTAGSQPIAQAAIIDISSPEHKIRNIGLILLASCLGFTIGPLIGGVLSDSHLVSWFNFSTPLYFSALVLIGNIILLHYLLKETFTHSKKVRIQLSQSIDIFVSAFKHHKLRKLSFIFFIMIYGWSNFFAFMPMFALHKYSYSPLQISLLLAVMGVGFSIGCGYLVEYCSNRFDLKKVLVVSLLLTTLWMYVTIVSQNEIYLWIMVFLTGITMALAYSLIIVFFSNQVSENEQGWAMGVSGSIMALCFGFSSFLTGYLASYGDKVPIYLALFGILASGLLMINFNSAEPTATSQ